MNRYLKFVIPVFWAVFMLAPVAAGSGKALETVAKDGVLDLRSWDFHRRQRIALSGEWGFAWQRHVLPGETGAHLQKLIPERITAPGSWTGHRYGGEIIPGQGFATYHLRVLLPDNPPELGLKFLDMATSFAVFVNGRRIYTAGVPGKTPAAALPAYKPGVAALPADMGRELDVVIHAANFHHWQGGMWEPVLLGPVEDLRRFRENRLFMEALLFGAILIMGVYHLFLYRFRPQDLSSLWFALFCFMLAVRTITTGERFIVCFLPDLPFDLLIRMLYISFYLCVPLFILYYRRIFPNEMPRWVERLTLLTYGAAAVFTLATPPRIFSTGMPVMQAITLLLLGFGIYASWRTLRDNRRDAGVFVIGLFIFSLTIINDILYVRQVIFTTHLVPFGLIVFIFSQAVLISKRFSRAFFMVRKQQKTLVKEVIQRKKAEAAAQIAAEQEKYALVGQVAGKLAHDFNNILGAVMGHTELSLLDCNQPNIRQSLEVILDQTRQGRVLTRNLVTFARDQEPRQICLDINEKIEMALSLLKNDLSNIRVESDLAPDLPVLSADPGMIEQALVNLIQNSVHAMGLVKNPVLKIKTSNGPNRIFVEISDNGCGIPEAHHRDIFSPAFTLKGIRDELGVYRTDIKGTGYGMANVKKCMDKHKAGISLVSGQGEGTTFVLSFPKSSNDCITPGPAPGANAVKGVTGKRILLVEDDDPIAFVLKQLLTSQPFSNDLVVVRDAESAMVQFDTSKNGGKGFDLVSLDYLMPGHLTGLDVYHHIRRRDTDLPILFVSGNLHFIESIKALQDNDPFLDFLAKPFENKEYAAMITKWLAQGRGPVI